MKEFRGCVYAGVHVLLVLLPSHDVIDPGGVQQSYGPDACAKVVRGVHAVLGCGVWCGGILIRVSMRGAGVTTVISDGLEDESRHI